MSPRHRREGDPPPANDRGARDEAALRAVISALQGLRFGTVSIIVQDGVVGQVERTEKTRLT